MVNRGKWLIVLMFLAALAAASFAVWFRFQQGKQALALWGAEHASRIRNAESVVLYKIAPTTDEPATLRYQNESFAAQQTLDISHSADLIHVRKAFLSDAYFAWQSRPAPAPAWSYAIRFTDPQQATTTLLISGDSGDLALVEAGVPATMNPAILKSIREKVLEHLLARAAAASRAAPANTKETE